MGTLESARSIPGLSEVEAGRRLARLGPNALPRQRSRGPLRQVGAQLRDPMLLLLMVVAAIAVATSDYSDAGIVALVIVVNTGMGLVQEHRASRAIESLDRLSAPSAVVVRDGVAQRRAATDVVPGDVVELAAGDVVPADGTLVAAQAIELDEAVLTGESVPRAAVAGEEVLAGAVVTRGRASLMVSRTGAGSALGRIAALVRSAPTPRTPLQRQLAQLSGQLVVAVCAVSTVVLFLGLQAGRPFAEMLLVALSLAVAAVPESLPAVVTVALAVGAARMAARHAIARGLAAVETLGSVDVLASDKTGTVTQGTMRVAAVWTPESGLRSADDPAGFDDPALRRLLRDVVLCNDAPAQVDTGESSSSRRWSGDPIERGLLELAGRLGYDGDRVRSAWVRSGGRPFDPATRSMTTLHESGDGRRLEVTKGAPEAVLARLGRVPAGDDAGAVAERLARQGHRILLVADAEQRKPGPGCTPKSELVGLVALADPPRADAGRLVRDLRTAGVRLVLVTGDHASTAASIAQQIGLLEPGAEASPDGTRVVVADGRADLIDSSTSEDVAVFARTLPEDKVRIIESLQQAGHVVAVTGDGVNDAPALRRADIGVAMGRGGTEVARQAADLVLADDNLVSVLVAIEEGRRIRANVRSFLRYGLAGGLAEILVMLVGPWVGLGLPLVPAQILWINLLTHGLPGVAFGGEPVDRSAISRGPRGARDSLLGGGLAAATVWTGTATASVALAAGLLAVPMGVSTSTSIFLTLGVGQLGVALALRSRTGAPRLIRQRGLEGAVAAALVLQLLAAVLPGLRELLATAPPGLAQLGVCAGLAVLPGLVVTLVRSHGGRGLRAHRARRW